MIATVDGRIVTRDWPELREGLREYERTAATLGGDAWMCGRVTMRAFAAGLRSAQDLAREAAAPGSPSREDYVAPGEHGSYAFAVDARGKLVWDHSDLDGDHIVAILAPVVSDAYLADLRRQGVSYLIAGRRQGPPHEIDFALALEKVAARFGVRTLLLEGGGGINGSLLHAGLVDEVSLLLAPIADGTAATASVFDVVAGAAGHRPRRLALRSCEPRAEGVVWLRYGVEAARD